MGHTQKKQFIGKEIYKQSSHGRDVSSETYPRSLPQPETSFMDGWMASYHVLISTDV